ncbi:MAG: dTDP-glucose 4,6-dehydratase [Chlamydiae bacterium]|nr:dTDP-glucose 4,6-dehydratase [Chlamydiota bacterium]
MIFVTGGAGFIGSNFVLNWLKEETNSIINLDKLIYSGNLLNLKSLKNNPLHIFVQGDIQDRALIRKLLNQYKPQAIVHFAAETHVDRSIYDPTPFIQTNVIGTLHLLQETLDYWKNLNEHSKNHFRFLHVSTDEVYGSLRQQDEPFKETSRYAPNSPYSASKAASDHLVRAFHNTYGLPTLITHCSNNYGPFQFPEKLVPLMIINATQGKILPIYGDGLNIRNWLYVNEHYEALCLVLSKGKPGEHYNIGSETEITNMDLVHTICSILDDLKPNSPYVPHASLIQFIKDRPGHDRRYSIDCSKMRQELGWKPKENFKANFHKTIEWYLNNMTWVEKVMSGEYRKWIQLHYKETS